ncbi:MAG: ribosomal RNA small subunit methyltransferase A [Candidatus Micrarchaeota archaeon]|nr:ribosomal RNA small subunit methyltransferase A [Candidatus Micrarchaeota archaeon]
MSTGPIGGLRPKKSLGQVFLHNKDVASAEAAHAGNKTVLEIGPGHGILTELLCQNAKEVIAVEKDRVLCKLLRARIRSGKLRLIEGDFLELGDSDMDVGKVDIVISNIPYNISSSVIDWLERKNLQAVLCLQKEFVEHMLAKPGTRDYSRLSVMSSLLYRIVKIMDVSRGCFTPVPKVDSVVIYMQPKRVRISDAERKLIGLLMQHKKKTVRNALVDSHSYLGMEKSSLRELAEGIGQRDRRPFEMEPEEILAVAGSIAAALK